MYGAAAENGFVSAAQVGAAAETGIPLECDPAGSDGALVGTRGDEAVARFSVLVIIYGG